MGDGGNSGGAGAGDGGMRYNERSLFVMELELVQCLANPAYLQCEFSHSASFLKAFHLVLSQRGLFEDARFVAYLEYLMYWRRPEYISYIQ